MNDSDSYISSSGTLPSSVNLSNRHFTDFEEIPSSGHNLLIKAKRFGRWFLLKSIKPEFRENDFCAFVKCLNKSVVFPNFIA